MNEPLQGPAERRSAPERNAGKVVTEIGTRVGVLVSMDHTGHAVVTPLERDVGGPELATHDLAMNWCIQVLASYCEGRRWAEAGPSLQPTTTLRTDAFKLLQAIVKERDELERALDCKPRPCCDPMLSSLCKLLQRLRMHEELKRAPATNPH